MLALVSSGGGSKGAHSVGVWQRRLEEQPEILESKLVIGTSTGALISALLGLTCATKDRSYFYDLVDIYKRVEQGNIMTSRDTLAGLLGTEGLLISAILYGRNSLFDFSPISKLLDDYMSEKRWERLIVSDVEVGFCCTNLETAKSELITTRTHPDPKILKSALLASASQPVLMGPVNIQGVEYVDGGLVDFIPVRFCFDRPITKVIAVSTQVGLPKGDKSYPNVLGQLTRSLEILTENNYYHNKFAAEALGCQRTIEIEWIEPSSPIKMNALEFKQPEMKNLVLKGWQDGALNVNRVQL